MRHFAFLTIILVIVGAFSLSSYSQNPTTPEEKQLLRIQDVRDANQKRRENAMSGLYDKRPLIARSKRSIDDAKAQKEAQKMFAQLIKPDPADEEKYKAVLASGKSGLLKLLSNHDCVTSNLIRTDGKCEGFMDGGSAYSFRSKSYFSIAEGYRSRYPLSDLQFNQDILRAKGFFEHGIMVELGDVPVENIKLTDAGMKFLGDFKPATTRPEADTFESSLDKRIVSGNYIYSNGIVPRVNTTYAIRIVAYKVRKFDRSQNLNARGYKYNWLWYDRRADMTIAFRIVRCDADGNLTLLWKELEHKKAPSLKY